MSLLLLFRPPGVVVGGGDVIFEPASCSALVFGPDSCSTLDFVVPGITPGLYPGFLPGSSSYPGQGDIVTLELTAAPDSTLVASPASTGSLVFDPA